MIHLYFYLIYPMNIKYERKTFFFFNYEVSFSLFSIKKKNKTKKIKEGE